MRKLKIIEHLSLDGVIQHSADGDDFPYSDWTAPFRPDAGRDAMLLAYGEHCNLLVRTGERSCAHGSPARRFELVGTHGFAAGIVLNVYKLVGMLKPGQASHVQPMTGSRTTSSRQTSA